MSRKYSMVPWTNSYGITAFESLVDKMINEAFPSLKNDWGISIESAAYPRIDIYEDNPDTIVIEADCHGYDEKDVGVNFDSKNSVLTIEGARQNNSPKEERKYFTREIKRGRFARTFTIGKDMDTDKISVDFQPDGLLKISIPRAKKNEHIKKLL